MSNEKFTPGEWWNDDMIICTVSENMPIADCDLDTGKRGEGGYLITYAIRRERMANASLCAASPDMYKALKEAKEVIRSHYFLQFRGKEAAELWRIYNEHSPEMKRINAALQKANPEI